MNVNKTGYLKGSKTKDNPYNVIPSGNITTANMAFPIFANGKLLMPDTGDYKFNTDTVLETPAFYKGGQMKKPRTLKKYSKDTLKMQAGGGVDPTTLATAAGGGTPWSMVGTLAAKTAASDAYLFGGHQQYKGLDAPELNWGQGLQAGVPGIAKMIMDFNQDKKQWGQNLKQDRAQERVDYDATHKPYGTRGYMQGTPNEQVYSLYDGGMPTKKQQINTQTAITDSYVTGTVSLSKQDGGKIPDDLNELFDRAMEESGGDESKAEQLVQQYQEHPEMIQNKGKKKHQLKKKHA